MKRLLVEHLHAHYALYGEFTGVRTARKHIGWYVRALPDGEAFRTRMNLLDDTTAQIQAVVDYFDHLGTHTDRLPTSNTSPEAAAEGEADGDAWTSTASIGCIE